jgi:FKBP-type peptidyl-prolyl cis-trans isomerase
MKKILLAITSLCLIGIATSCHKSGTLTINTDETPQLTNKADSISWAMGFTLAQNVASTGIKIDREIMLQAICATLDSKQQPMTQEQTFAMLQEIEKAAFFNKTNNEKAQLEETRARESEYFAKLTKENPKIKKSDKGFYYEVLKEGNGRQGAPGLVVYFDYKGSFTNGQIFDQTYGNREPITHVISESLMPGLFEGFCMMKGGSTYRFYFPAEMAFGANGAEGIPPYSTVIYEVELHEVRDL